MKKIFILILTTLLVACTKSNSNEENYIGEVHMTDNKTLCISLHLNTDDNHADAYYELIPSDPRYNEMINHIDGIEPGESKALPAWPSESNTNKENR